MTEAPEKLYATGKTNGAVGGIWHSVSQVPSRGFDVQYIRQDIHDKALAENKRLRKALSVVSSSEALTVSFMRRDNREGLELKARMEYARKALTKEGE